MKKIIFLILIFLTYSSFGQNPKEKPKSRINIYSVDSKIVVIDNENLHPGMSPIGIFVNGIFIGNESSMGTVDSNKIESLKVEKEEFEINEKKYYGKILLKIKTDYKPNFIKINELFEKYLTLDSNPVVLQIDNKTIKDFDELIVDEKFILKIEIDKIKTDKNGNQINLVKLVTKTPENIEKANEIRIRGIE